MKKLVREELVLIVNDRQNDYLQLSEQLATEGLKVSIENERVNVVVAAQLLKPDIILLDVSHLESEELAEISHQLKSNIKTQNISLIYIISLTQSSVRKSSGGWFEQAQSPHQINKSDWRGIDYITKPARLEEILVRIKTHLALRQINNRIQQEISNRCQIEALLEQSQQMFGEQFGSEIWELMAAKQEFLTTKREPFNCDRELEEFANSVARDLQALIFSLEGLTEPLLGDGEDRLAEEQSQYVESLANCDFQLQALVRDLSVYANQKES